MTTDVRWRFLCSVEQTLRADIFIRCVEATARLWYKLQSSDFETRFSGIASGAESGRDRRQS